MLKGLHLAQVVQIHPTAPDPTAEDEPPYAGTLDVILVDYAPIDDAERTYRVRVLRPRAHPSAGVYALPEVGDWGLVAFYANDPRAGVWLGSLDDALRNMIPEELWDQDPYAELRHLPSDRYAIYHGDGTEEHVWPDGTFLKLTARKDGSVGNATYREKLTRRRVRRKVRKFASRREDYQPHPEPPHDLVFRHASGAFVHLSADGSIEVRTARGHRIRLFDSTEKARDPETGAPTLEETPQRERSAIVLESEVGHRITLWDDPVQNASRYVEVRTAGGHTVRLQDLPIPEVEVRHAGGHVLRMAPGEVALEAQGSLRLTATGEVVIDGALIRIG